VSRALGYEEIGREPTADGRARIRVRITREEWEQRRSIPVEISGLAACRDLFGV
jgi:hypothetical protein